MSVSPFKRLWVEHIRSIHPQPSTGRFPIVVVSVEDGCETCDRFNILAELDEELEESVE